MVDVTEVRSERRERQARGESRPGRRSARRRVPLGSRIAGALGELLLTLGVLLGLFVVWQLWWTDVVGAREADAAIEQFEETLPESPVLTATSQTGPSPEEPLAGNGERFATLLVPDWGAEYEMPIAEGVGRTDVLDAGAVGHYPDTALPGQVGNFALAGHRQTYGRPFFSIDSLTEGDPLIVQTAQAWYVYRVTTTDIVMPSDVEVIAPVPSDPAAAPTERMITLTTCHPLWSTAQRYVVHGVLEYWVDRSEGRPAELIGGEA